MVTLLCLCGLTCGGMRCILKWLSIVIKNKDYSTVEYWIIGVGIALVPLEAFFQLKFLNKAIAKYQQIEVAAIYQVNLMVFTILCGLILLQEAKAYTNASLCLILVCTCLCLGGIFTLMIKQNLISDLDTK